MVDYLFNLLLIMACIHGKDLALLAGVMFMFTLWVGQKFSLQEETFKQTHVVDIVLRMIVGMICLHSTSSAQTQVHAL